MAWPIYLETKKGTKAMYDLITITPIIAIGGNCNYCKIDLDETSLVYQEAQGKTIYFICDGCGHEYQIILEEGN